jgi:hypothetical protein
MAALPKIIHQIRTERVIENSRQIVNSICLRI